jgi:leader peptidase (prepilin peptidase)/N-methyltransferase
VIAERILGPAISSRRATAIAIATGIGAGMVWRFGWSAVLPAYLALAALSGIVVVTDATEHRIPAKVVLPAYPIAAALLALACAAAGPWWPLARAACAAVVVGGGYLFIALVFPGQFGLGDVRLGGLLGGYLGYLGWPSVIAGTFLGWAIGAIVVALFHGLPRRHVVAPLGPFLIAGAFVAILTSR